jgi:hypothetical protein
MGLLLQPILSRRVDRTRLNPTELANKWFVAPSLWGSGNEPMTSLLSLNLGMRGQFLSDRCKTAINYILLLGIWIIPINFDLLRTSNHWRAELTDGMTDGQADRQ